MAFLEGYATGLALIMLIGPVLFVLLGATLERGRGPGFAVALGIFVSDIVAVLLCTFGVAPHLQAPGVARWLALGGGALLLGFGVFYLVAPGVKAARDVKLDARGWLGFFVRGFGVNFVNPFVFMVWIGIIGAATVRHGFDLDLAWFLSGTLLGILTLDSLKVIFAHRIRPLLAPRVLRILFGVSGVVLVGFGLRLVYAGLVL